MRSGLITEASQSMYNKHHPRRQLIEPPFHLDSHRFQTLQAADWITGIVGELGALWVSQGVESESETMFRRYFERRLEAVQRRSGIRN